jgi:hypothetical protein
MSEMDETRPWTLTLAAALLMIFSFVNLAIPLIRGPENPVSPSLSGQLLLRSAGRAMGYQPAKVLATPIAGNQAPAQVVSGGMPGFGSASSNAGPNILALALLCLAGILSGLAFLAAVGLLQTRWYGLALTILVALLLLIISVPQLLDFLSLGLPLNLLPPLVAVDVLTGTLALLLTLLPVSLRAFRKRKL